MKAILGCVGAWLIAAGWVTCGMAADAGAVAAGTERTAFGDIGRAMVSTAHGLSPTPLVAAAAPSAGSELAKSITQITGVAISPLLGTSAVGAWRYFETPKARRGSLPWFAQPWFWMPALALVGLAFAKDALGPVTPTALKKPLDVAEVLENKVSGLVAAGAFVPWVVGLLGSLPGTESPDLAGAGLAAATGSSWVQVLLVPFAVVAFLVVWLLGHVINVLILVSPFTTVDTVLKLARTALLGTVVGTSFVDERVGAVWACLIILVGALLAGWSFRITVLGSVFLTDVLSRRRRWFRPDPRRNWLFLARDLGDAPLRTYGTLARDDAGGLRFSYRPFLVGRERTVDLPPGDYGIGRGFVYADLLRWQGVDDERWGILPPRYKGHEEAMTRHYGFRPPTDVGLRAVWRFLVELLGGGRTDPVAGIGRRAAG